jgi:uncharacterized DUF497 family protein
MKVFQWDNEKNEWLKEHRNICFEQVVILFEREDVLDVIEHPNQDSYPDQKIAIVNINDYAYLVPFLQDGEEIFLKTVIPSRKATNKYVRYRK